MVDLLPNLHLPGAMPPQHNIQPSSDPMFTHALGLNKGWADKPVDFSLMVDLLYDLQLARGSAKATNLPSLIIVLPRISLCVFEGQGHLSQHEVVLLSV